MNEKYFGEWGGYEDMVRDFGDSTEKPSFMPKPEEIIFASYALPSYGGDAVVLFQKDEKLYEVEGSHCSCNGLDDQWFPGEVTWAALGLRNISNPNCGWLYAHDQPARDRMMQLVAEHTAPEAES